MLMFALVGERVSCLLLVLFQLKDEKLNGLDTGVYLESTRDGHAPSMIIRIGKRINTCKLKK